MKRWWNRRKVVFFKEKYIPRKKVGGYGSKLLMNKLAQPIRPFASNWVRPGKTIHVGTPPSIRRF